MQHNVYIYILVMGIVTYLIRVLPLTLIRREIKNRFIRSFLYYVPYVTLAVMTFPAILDATGSTASALAAFIAAILIAWFGGSLFQVAVIACVVVFVSSITGQCHYLPWDHLSAVFQCCNCCVFHTAAAWHFHADNLQTLNVIVLKNFCQFF